MSRPGVKGDMAQQAVDLAREGNASALRRWLRSGSKLLLPACCCLLVALFYLSAFFPKHHGREAAAFIFLGLCVLSGLHPATAVPHAAPLLVSDVVHVVQAAPLVGALGWLSGRIGLLDQRVLPASLYCGAFAGMTSAHVLPSTLWVTV